MRKTIQWTSMTKTVLMLLAVLGVSMSMASCSSDDDDKGGSSEIAQKIYIDKVEKACEFYKCTYTENDKNTIINIVFTDGSQLRLQVGKGNLGKDVLLYERNPKGYNEEEYEDVNYTHTSKDIDWYGGNYVSSDDEAHYLLGSGSHLKVTKSGNTFTVWGEFIFQGSKNGLAVGENHVIQVSIKFEAVRE